MIGCSHRLRATLRIALLAMLLGLSSGAAAQAPAAPAAPPPGMTQQQFDTLVGAISQAVVKQLTEQGVVNPAGPAAGGAPAPAASEGDDARETSRNFMMRLSAVLAAVPEIGAAISRAADILGQGSRGFLGFVLVLAVVIGGGLLAEWAIRRALDGAKRRIAGDSPPPFARLAAIAVLDLLAYAGLYAVSHGLDALWFAGQEPQSRLAGFLLASVLSWRLQALLFRIWLRPDLPVARIIPMTDEAAVRLYRMFQLGLLVLICLRTWTVFLITIGTPVDAVAASALVSNLLTVALLLTIVWSARAPLAVAFSDLVEGQSRSAAAKLALAQNWVWIAAVIIAVMSASQAIAVISGRITAGRGIVMTLVVLIGLIFTEFLFRYIMRRSQEQKADGEAPSGPRMAELVSRCVRMATRIAALVFVAQVWAVDILGLVGRNEWQELARSSISAGIVLFLAFIAWESVKFATDRYVAQKPASPGTPGQDSEATGVSNASRLQTLIPLLRVAFAVFIVILTVLIVLSQLGVNVAPLIAGASVIGLAISFGSQTLVRDIVSGIFYLADDAFRVGEYIDVGRAKGTVEGFTLRSIKMRHQNGQVHTIPFGQLGQITNFSRDWTTVKFNLRLARDTDTELVRKTVKKIGLEMLEDPELKAELIEPLKMQGIADIADNALVVRFKFTCRPGKPTLIQRQAIKRMVPAFAEKGIEFAKATVSVTTAGGAVDPAAIAAANATLVQPTAAAQPG